MQTFKPELTQIYSVAYAPNAVTVASGGRGIVYLLDARSGLLLKSWRSRNMRTPAIFSPNGGTLAIASRNNSILLADLKTGDIKKTLMGRADETEGAIISIAYSPDGNFLASGSTDNRVRIWNMQTD